MIPLASNSTKLARNPRELNRSAGRSLINAMEMPQDVSFEIKIATIMDKTVAASEISDLTGPSLYPFFIYPMPMGNETNIKGTNNAIHKMIKSIFITIPRIYCFYYTIYSHKTQEYKFIEKQ